jgi:hypothetical protein
MNVEVTPKRSMPARALSGSNLGCRTTVPPASSVRIENLWGAE